MTGKGFFEFRKTGNLIPKSTTKGRRINRINEFDEDAPLLRIFPFVFLFPLRTFPFVRSFVPSFLLPRCSINDATLRLTDPLERNLAPRVDVIASLFSSLTLPTVVTSFVIVFEPNFLSCVSSASLVFVSLPGTGTRSALLFLAARLRAINRRSKHPRRSHTIHFPAD